jgi:hypothetical protein
MPPPSRSRTRCCQLDSATTQGHRPPDSVDTHHNSISATTRGPCGLDSTAIHYGLDAVGRQSEATAPRCRRSLVRGHRPSTPPPTQDTAATPRPLPLDAVALRTSPPPVRSTGGAPPPPTHCHLLGLWWADWSIVRRSWEEEKKLRKNAKKS